MKISEEEFQIRKDRIIHCAFLLFCEKGIDGVTIKEIAQAAGVGEKSVYRYFNTKTELVISTVYLLWKEIVSELIYSVKDDYSDRDGLGQIKCLLECFRHLFENYREYVLFSYDYKLFLIRNDAFLTEAAYIDEITPIQELFVEALNKGMEDGSIGVKEDPYDVYYAVWGLMRGYIVKIVIYDKMYDGANMWKGHFDMACRFILNGLASDTVF